MSRHVRLDTETQEKLRISTRIFKVDRIFILYEVRQIR